MEEGRVRKIIHVDIDSFYASVEQRDNLDLKNRPLAVGYPAKRGVVAAASYEARRFGVRSAMPSTVAMRRCPELVLVPPRFNVYRAVSRQIHAIFKDYTSLVEPLSLDEAYLDVTNNLSGLATAWETAKDIRARILAETKLTASAGVSLNKFLAKLASDQRKPNGQFAIMPGEAEAFVAALPIAKFHGVRLVLRQARICGAKPLSSCRRGLAKQAVGTLRSRAAETIVRFNRTESESLRGRRRPSRRIWSIPPGSKRG
jgi:DNA polymerase IV